jgi:hypothetical protein
MVQRTFKRLMKETGREGKPRPFLRWITKKKRFIKLSINLMPPF